MPQSPMMPAAAAAPLALGDFLKDVMLKTVPSGVVSLKLPGPSF
jgi:hypothetical protein